MRIIHTIPKSGEGDYYTVPEGESGERMKRVYEFRLLKSGELLERARKNGVETVSWKIFNDPL